MQNSAYIHRLRTNRSQYDFENEVVQPRIFVSVRQNKYLSQEKYSGFEEASDQEDAEGREEDGKSHRPAGYRTDEEEWQIKMICGLLFMNSLLEHSKRIIIRKEHLVW